MFTCGKCKAGSHRSHRSHRSHCVCRQGNKTTYFQMQTRPGACFPLWRANPAGLRSSDEPMTTFVTCKLLRSERTSRRRQPFCRPNLQQPVEVLLSGFLLRLYICKKRLRTHKLQTHSMSLAFWNSSLTSGLKSAAVMGASCSLAAQIMIDGRLDTSKTLRVLSR